MDGRVLDGRELRVQMARYGRPASPRRYNRDRDRGRDRRDRSRDRYRRRSRYGHLLMLNGIPNSIDF